MHPCDYQSRPPIRSCNRTERVILQTLAFLREYNTFSKKAKREHALLVYKDLGLTPKIYDMITTKTTWYVMHDCVGQSRKMYITIEGETYEDVVELMNAQFGDEWVLVEPILVKPKIKELS